MAVFVPTRRNIVLALAGIVLLLAVYWNQRTSDLRGQAGGGTTCYVCNPETFAGVVGCAAVQVDTDRCNPEGGVYDTFAECETEQHCVDGNISTICYQLGWDSTICEPVTGVSCDCAIGVCPSIQELEEKSQMRCSTCGDGTKQDYEECDASDTTSGACEDGSSCNDCACRGCVQITEVSNEVPGCLAFGESGVVELTMRSTGKTPVMGTFVPKDGFDTTYPCDNCDLSGDPLEKNESRTLIATVSIPDTCVDTLPITFTYTPHEDDGSCHETPLVFGPYNVECRSDCSASVCGNNVREGSEQCDGTDTGSCSAGCKSNCTCQGVTAPPPAFASSVHVSSTTAVSSAVSSVSAVLSSSATSECSEHDDCDSSCCRAGQCIQLDCAQGAVEMNCQCVFVDHAQAPSSLSSSVHSSLSSSVSSADPDLSFCCQNGECTVGWCDEPFEKAAACRESCEPNPVCGDGKVQKEAHTCPTSVIEPCNVQTSCDAGFSHQKHIDPMERYYGSASSTASALPSHGGVGVRGTITACGRGAGTLISNGGNTKENEFSGDYKITLAGGENAIGRIHFKGTNYEFPVSNDITKWHCYALVSDGEYISFYVDGKLVGKEKASYSNANSGAGSPVIGAVRGNTGPVEVPFQGGIAQTGIYNCALSPEDIATLSECKPKDTCKDHPPEQCDDGEKNSDEPGALCRKNCTKAGCGDGILDPGEECELGEKDCEECKKVKNSAPDPSNNAKTSTSQQAPRCGDGIVQEKITCDQSDTDPSSDSLPSDTNSLESQKHPCTDSDGGAVADVLGEVVDVYGKTHKDFCFSGHSVMEWTCRPDLNTGVKGQVIECGGGSCVMGVCRGKHFVPAKQGECTDSDGGISAATYGEVHNAPYTYITDKCVTPSILEEAYCEQGPTYGAATTTIQCRPNTCEDGACELSTAFTANLLAQTQWGVPNRCSDTDDGRNVAVKGTALDYGVGGTDECISATELREWGCYDALPPGKMAQAIIYTCDGECKDGACVSGTATIGRSGNTASGDDAQTSDNACIPYEGEECDDGNTIDGDGCSATCKKEAPAIDPPKTEPPRCGDGIVQPKVTCGSTTTVSAPPTTNMQSPTLQSTDRAQATTVTIPPSRNTTFGIHCCSTSKHEHTCEIAVTNNSNEMSESFALRLEPQGNEIILTEFDGSGIRPFAEGSLAFFKEYVSTINPLRYGSVLFETGTIPAKDTVRASIRMTSQERQIPISTVKGSWPPHMWFEWSTLQGVEDVYDYLKEFQAEKFDAMNYGLEPCNQPHSDYGYDTGRMLKSDFHDPRRPELPFQDSLQQRKFYQDDVVVTSALPEKKQSWWSRLIGQLLGGSRYTCTETDSGLDTNMKGAVKDSDGNHKVDYCYSDTEAIEWYCNNPVSPTHIEVALVGCNSTCDDGVCVRGYKGIQTDIPQNILDTLEGDNVPYVQNDCTDSDGGVDLGGYGEVRAGGQVFRDRCSEQETRGSMVIERYCDPNVRSGIGTKLARCRNNDCRGGACAQELSGGSGSGGGNTRNADDSGTRTVQSGADCTPYSGEECDDGNTKDGDGCSAQCTREDGSQGDTHSVGITDTTSSTAPVTSCEPVFFYNSVLDLRIQDPIHIYDDELDGMEAITVATCAYRDSTTYTSDNDSFYRILAKGFLNGNAQSGMWSYALDEHMFVPEDGMVQHRDPGFQFLNTKKTGGARYGDALLVRPNVYLSSPAKFGWVHFAAKFTDDWGALYRDGIAYGFTNEIHRVTQPLESIWENPNTPLTIGGQVHTAENPEVVLRPYPGALSQIRIYPCMLSDNEIRTLAQHCPRDFTTNTTTSPQGSSEPERTCHTCTSCALQSGGCSRERCEEIGLCVWEEGLVLSVCSPDAEKCSNASSPLSSAQSSSTQVQTNSSTLSLALVRSSVSSSAPLGIPILPELSSMSSSEDREDAVSSTFSPPPFPVSSQPPTVGPVFVPFHSSSVSFTSPLVIAQSSSSVPTARELCGNLRFDLGEQCDTGVNICRKDRKCDFATCTCVPLSGVSARCGNGVLDDGEQCDGSPLHCGPARSCDSTCTCVWEDFDAPGGPALAKNSAELQQLLSAASTVDPSLLSTFTLGGFDQGFAFGMLQEERQSLSQQLLLRIFPGMPARQRNTLPLPEFFALQDEPEKEPMTIVLIAGQYFHLTKNGTPVPIPPASPLATTIREAKKAGTLRAAAPLQQGLVAGSLGLGNSHVAQLQPLVPNYQPQTPETGPGAAVIIATGVGAGLAWARRRGSRRSK